MESPLEHPILFSKNVERKCTPHFKNSEFVSTPHSVFTKCRICLNCPLCFWKIQSSHELRPLWSLLELLSCFYKMQSSFQLPILFLQNMPSAWTPPHCVFKKCRVYTNSSLSFPKMESPIEHSILISKNAELKRTPHCVF